MSQFHITNPVLPRRHFLWKAGSGLGGIALAWMLKKDALASPRTTNEQSYTPLSTDFPPKANRVVHIFAFGGVSHVDTFDYKPELVKHDGQAISGNRNVEPFFGKPGNLMKNKWEFHRRGKSGLWVSDLFPNIATCVDDITFIYSMVAKSNNHGPALFQMNTGFIRTGFPSLGSWLSYGLGTENQDLPAFVVLPDPRGAPGGGQINWTSGFLPATHQGTPFRTTTGEVIPNLETPKEIPTDRRNAAMEFLKEINQKYLDNHPGGSALAAQIRAYELGARMQTSIPEVVDFSSETEYTRRLYGLNTDMPPSFGRNCLLARRLLERGVRFVQLYHGRSGGSGNWDAHGDVISNHNREALTMDKPVAGLLADLKTRGMLEDTLVIWTTEFGRTPTTQGLGKSGRDHHPKVFTCWLAGAGVKPGFGYGLSDDVGFEPAENPTTIYDFHATILHLLGLDHEKLTFYHNGINRRLTDVHGHVLKQLLS